MRHLVVLLFLTACTTGNVVYEDSLKVGVNFPMSGGLAVYGEPLLEGFTLGLEHANELPGKDITFILEDNEGDSGESAVATQKLIGQDVDVLITALIPGIGPSAPIAEQNGIPILHAVATDTFAEQYTWVFKDSIDAYYDCQELLKEAQKQGYESFALFGTIAEFTDSCEESVNKQGIKLRIVQKYSRGDTDYRTQLTKLKNANVDAIFVSAFSDDCIYFWKQARELDMDETFLLAFTQTGCGEDRAMQQVQDWDAEIIGLDFKIDKSGEEYLKFIQGYREKYNKEPSLEFFTSLAYDWAFYIRNAAQGCPTNDNECLRTALENVEHIGALGSVEFKPNHATFRPRYPVQYENNEWVPA